MTDRSSEERSRFEKLERDAGNIGANPRRDPDGRYASQLLEEKWQGWMARAALEDRQGAAPGRNPFGLAMGDGDYSCAVCGMGMKEPCEHWKAMISQVAADSRESTMIAVPTPTHPFEPDPEGYAKFCKICGVVKELHKKNSSLPSEGTPAKDCNMKSDPPVPSEATPSKEDFAAKFEECNRDRTQLFDECRRRGADIQELMEEIETLKKPAPAPEVQPPSDEVVSAAMKIRDLSMDLLGYEHVGGKIATGEITFYGLKKKSAPEVQGTPQKETSADAAAAKALHDYRNWLWLQQGGITLHEQHQELLKREAQLLKREREAGGEKE